MKRIGVDIDGVIADSHPVIISKLNKYFGKNYTQEDFVNFDPLKMFGISRMQLDSLIMASELEIIEESVPFPGAAETLRELASASRILIVSARTPVYFGQTAAWLKKFDIPYHELRLLGQHDKRGACQDLGVDLFIEDSKKNAVQISSCGIPVILMNAPYNRGSLPAMITRVFNWEEIRDYIVCHLQKLQS